jgi:hypothetical protein
MRRVRHDRAGVAVAACLWLVIEPERSAEFDSTVGVEIQTPEDV